MLKAGESKDDLILLNDFMPVGESVSSEFWYNTKTKTIYYTQVLAFLHEMPSSFFKVFVGKFKNIMKHIEDEDGCGYVRLYSFNWDREKFLLFVALLRYRGIDGFTIWNSFPKPTLQFNDDGTEGFFLFLYHDVIINV